jgi:hypothetical protein
MWTVKTRGVSSGVGGYRSALEWNKVFGVSCLSDREGVKRNRYKRVDRFRLEGVRTRMARDWLEIECPLLGKITLS